MRFLLLALAIFMVGCSETKTRPAPSSTDGTKSQTAKPGGTPSKVFVIDVRSKSEWDGGHVEQAVHIPHTEIGTRISEVTDDKGAKIVLYCAVGGRAGKAKGTLEDLGFTNVENGGGYDDVKDRFK